MKKYLKDMEASDLMKVIGHNSALEMKLYDLAMDNAQSWVEDYLYGLQHGGADYRIGAADRGSYFIIQEDEPSIYKRYEYTKFRTWLQEVRDTYGFLDSEKAHEIIDEFLDQADVCWDNYYVCDCTEEDMENADMLLFDKRAEAGYFILQTLMKEYDIDAGCLLDFLYEAFDTEEEYEAAYITDDCWNIFIDLPEMVIPAHTETIF